MVFWVSFSSTTILIYESRKEFDEPAPECLSAASGQECPVACECGFVRKMIGHIHKQAAEAG